MADLIQLKRSSTPDSVPAPEQLALGELALNVADGRIYFKKAGGDVVAVALLSDVGGGVVAIRKNQLMTASGTWNRPANMIGNEVRLTMIGGGSSGRRAAAGPIGWGGWSGQWVIDVPVDIGAETSVSCTVGAGGASVGTSTDVSNSGGATSFGAFASVIGGNNTAGSQAGGAPGGYGNASPVRPNGSDTPLGYGGVALAFAVQYAGAGGGLILDSSGVSGGSQANAATVAQGYGAGGAAGNTPSYGFAGAPGAILVEWMEAVTL